MNMIIAFCGIAASGWVSPDYSQPISPTRENQPSQPASQSAYAPQSYAPNNSRPSAPQAANLRPAARPASQTPRRPPRMPYAPTDPRALWNENIPLPPTSNDTGFLPSAATGGPAQRISVAGFAENGGRYSSSQKAFDRFDPSPTTSPYMMLNASTADGTLNTYTAYVRPAQEQQRINQDSERSSNGSEENALPPAPPPYYPPAFLNFGSYYPGYASRR